MAYPPILQVRLSGLLQSRKIYVHIPEQAGKKCVGPNAISLWHPKCPKHHPETVNVRFVRRFTSRKAGVVPSKFPKQTTPVCDASICYNLIYTAVLCGGLHGASWPSVV